MLFFCFRQGNPLGQFSFVSEQILSPSLWRNEDYRNRLTVYPYGVFKNESYHIVCTIRHPSDIQRPLNVFIQYSQCSIDHCLSNIIDKTCRLSSNEHVISTTSNRMNNYQTQFVSKKSHLLHDPSIGHQYLCCYEQNGLINMAKAITILSRKTIFQIYCRNDKLISSRESSYV